MNEALNKHRSGLILGTFAALLHVIWSVLVAIGAAKYLVNFAASLHFFNIVLTIQPFNFGISIILIALTFIFGYLLGYIFAAVVNFYNKK